jgi:hypothetical protein
LPAAEQARIRSTQQRVKRLTPAQRAELMQRWRESGNGGRANGNDDGKPPKPERPERPERPEKPPRPPRPGH